jgi:hypothetical protein
MSWSFFKSFNWVVVLEYLDKDQALSLKELLEAKEIPAIAKRHGAPLMWGAEINYKVIIKPSDAPAAAPIAGQFAEDQKKVLAQQQALLSSQCPTCKSSSIEKQEKITMLDKIRFYGVTPWICKECGGRWFS